MLQRHTSSRPTALTALTPGRDVLVDRDYVIPHAAKRPVRVLPDMHRRPASTARLEPFLVKQRSVARRRASERFPRSRADTWSLARTCGASRGWGQRVVLLRGRLAGSRPVMPPFGCPRGALGAEREELPARRACTRSARRQPDRDALARVPARRPRCRARGMASPERTREEAVVSAARCITSDQAVATPRGTCSLK